MVTYERLWETMKKKKVSQYHLIHYCNVSSSQIDRLKKNCYVSTHTIEKLCFLLQCRVEDIMTVYPDPEPEPVSEEPSTSAEPVDDPES
ncbi:XRE family transcriptional regulator [Lachnoclostridium sp. An14]|uniref:helix-turn-helix domain-containing protein n=1 Tax=Lachnoclostridium sp. An14 TaxID=1965562 RepID=UPI000B39E89F|nr:helix-turn-helix transcriptional regulator [Lachnoclostridium sp. An14]OUQ12834.1 XRE family transcriptional regulator [Lachnoclostridium sp. An14]